jgi:hypothetical protein
VPPPRQPLTTSTTLLIRHSTEPMSVTLYLQVGLRCLESLTSHCGIDAQNSPYHKYGLVHRAPMTRVWMPAGEATAQKVATLWRIRLGRVPDGPLSPRASI